MSRKIGRGGNERGRYVARETPVSEEEQALFAQAMRDVQPLAGRTRVPVVPAKGVRPRAVPPLIAALRANVGALGSAGDASEVFAPHMEIENMGEQVLARGKDVDRKLLKQLRQGEPAPQATLDLHGRTAAFARDAVVRFVSNAVAGGKTSVLIVHGRGHHSGNDGPVLKNVVMQVLSSTSLQAFVLAFASAPRALGADGATMVRLRRTR